MSYAARKRAPGTASPFTLEEQIAALRRQIGLARSRHAYLRRERRMSSEQIKASTRHIEALEAAAATLDELYLQNNPTLF